MRAECEMHFEYNLNDELKQEMSTLLTGNYPQSMVKSA